MISVFAKEKGAVNMKKCQRGYNAPEIKHFESIDGLRALSCLGIVVMHIQANTAYELQGNFVYDRFIPSLTWLVYLFMMISGFGMCAGYLEKFQSGYVDLEKFYNKRYKKVLPFFWFLLVIALLMERSI